MKFRAYSEKHSQWIYFSTPTILENRFTFREIIKKYPKTSFMIITKLWWIVSFFFTVYIIQNEMPTLRQFMLGSIYTIITLPLSYWLTYSFDPKDTK